MLFSIIIPVYNSEETLERCLESVAAQTYDDYEALLIDDGSFDNSLSICMRYSKMDSRFIVIHQNNEGPSAARNEGLERAKGAYFCFVDSDDYIVPEYLERLYKKLSKTQAEVLFFGYYKVDQEGTVLGKHCLQTYPDDSSLIMELSEKDLFGYTWVKTFSRQIIGDNRFPEDICLFEDELFTCSVLEKASRIAIISEAVYCYTIDGKDTLTGRSYADFCELSDRVFLAWEHLVQCVPGKDEFLQKKANSFVGRCRYYGFERDVNIQHFFESLAETKFFQIHTVWTLFDRLVQRHFWLGVRAVVIFYKAKNRAAVYKRCKK